MSNNTQTQVAKGTPFDNETNELISTDVQAAIEETGPYSFANVNANIAIPTVRQMSVYQEWEIQDGFEVDLKGEVVIYE